MKTFRSFIVSILIYTSVNFIHGKVNDTVSMSPFDFDQSNERIVEIIKPESTENFIDELLKPIDFTSRDSVNEFIHGFNHKLYARMILPHGGIRIHLYAFCNQGMLCDQGPDFYYSLFKIFTRRVKAAPGIDAPDIEYFLNKLPSVLHGVFNEKNNALSTTQKNIKNVLYNELSNNFESLQENPDQFLENISSRICADFLKKYIQPDDVVSIEKLRATLKEFLSLSLLKIMWCASEGKEIWNNFKAILQDVLQLKKHNIIVDNDDVKDLVDSAVLRLCYFIDIAGADIPLEFYEAVHNDMQSRIIGIDDFEEELESISTLREIIQATMIDNVGKAVARSKFGLVAKE